MEQRPEGLPQLHVEEEALTYDFWIKARGERKRDFIFSYAEQHKCDHPNLVITALGGNTYRCTKCNLFVTIVTAFAEPMHLATVKAAYQLLHFAKEFGVSALQEVLRQPHGQSDGSPHKGVVPDGMTFINALEALDTVNVNAEDGGAAELKALVETVWPSEREIKRRIKALRGSEAPGKQEQADALEKILEARSALVAGSHHTALGGDEGSRTLSALPKAAE